MTTSHGSELYRILFVLCEHVMLAEKPSLISLSYAIYLEILAEHSP